MRKEKFSSKHQADEYSRQVVTWKKHTRCPRSLERPGSQESTNPRLQTRLDSTNMHHADSAAEFSEPKRGLLSQETKKGHGIIDSYATILTYTYTHWSPESERPLILLTPSLIDFLLNLVVTVTKFDRHPIPQFLFFLVGLGHPVVQTGLISKSQSPIEISSCSFEEKSLHGECHPHWKHNAIEKKKLQWWNNHVGWMT